VITAGSLLLHEVTLGVANLVGREAGVRAAVARRNRTGGTGGRGKRVDDQLVFRTTDRLGKALGEFGAFVDVRLSLVKEVGVVTDSPVGQRGENLRVAGVVRRDRFCA
jgi:hypothetical protein